MLWKPVPGATASAGEFIAARSLIMEIHESAQWNPWVREDRAEEYEAAVVVFEQWTRAEPGFRQKTHEEFEAEQEQWWAGLDARVKAETARRERDHAERAAAYDPDRAQARLALLEQQGVLASAVRERDGIAARQIFPAMPEDSRQQKLAELERVIAAARAATEELAIHVGDAEAVADKHGWLPSERREHSLDVFAARRVAEVRELRERVAGQQEALKAAKDRTERARIREVLGKDTRRLAFLEAVLPMTADDMCSECYSPASWHDTAAEISGAGITRGPCPAWPQWQQKVQKMRDTLMALVPKSSRPAAA